MRLFMTGEQRDQLNGSTRVPSDGNIFNAQSPPPFEF